MDEDLQQYLSAGEFMDFTHPSLTAIRQKALDDSPVETARRLFYFVRDEIRYDPVSPMFMVEDYRASTILERGYGYCVQKAIVLTALARGAGIPCRLCFADIVNHRTPPDMLKLLGTNLFTYHGYNELYLNGRWLKATPAFDRRMCERNGFRAIEFDGEHDGTLPATDLHGNRHFEYVRQLGRFADPPLTEMIHAYVDLYGKANPDLLEMWKRKERVDLKEQLRDRNGI
ncbi:MAG TPA: transglutaminase-like domain-containing protein [bacterium]|nr:transglutaminase-like domain-containing protein [bacterium]